MFCGEYGLLHKEDAIPKWIGRAFNTQAGPGAKWVKSRTKTDGTQKQQYRPKVVGGPTSVKVPEVCQRLCNGGWMSGLETAVKPILLPMMFGDDELELPVHDLTTLAAWLTKTALVFDMDDGVPPLMTDDQRHWFGKRQEPFPDSMMWLSAYAGTVLGPVYHGISGKGSGIETPFGKSALDLGLIFGNVALKVVIPLGPEVGAVEGFAPGSEAPAVPIWPNVGVQTWPPPAVLDDTTIASFLTLPANWQSLTLPAGFDPFHKR